MWHSRSALTATAVLALLGAPATAFARGHSARVSVQVTAPATASVGQTFAIDLSAPGTSVAGFEAVVAANGKAAQVAAAVPPSAGARLLNAQGTNGARVGFFANTAVDPSGLVAQVLVQPTAAGRLQVRLAAPLFVDSAGHVIRARLSKRTFVVQVGSSRTRYDVARPAAAAGGRHGRAHRDLTGDGAVTSTDLSGAVGAWSNGPANARNCGIEGKAGDVNGDGCTDVVDLQTLAAQPTVSLSASPSQVAQAHAFAPTMTWVVNTNSDLPDANPGDGICATSDGTCSLRAAIDEANRRPGDDLIDFNIPGPAPQTIQLTSELTWLNAPIGSLEIDGYSQPGAAVNTDPVVSNAIPGIILRGYSQVRNDDMLFVSSGGNIIRGLDFMNYGRAIHIYGPDANNNTIVGNFFGVDPAGNKQTWNGGYSAMELDTAANNIIGTPAPADRNVIAGAFDGIVIDNPGADNNVIQNNLIGMNPQGTKVLGGSCTGVDHNVGPKYNIVGGLAPGQRNVISGWGCDGVEWSHGWNQALPTHQDMTLQWNVDYNQVLGNYIGLKPDGSFDPTWVNALNNKGTNDGSGVNIWDVANYNTVQGNYISAYENGVMASVYTSGNIITNNVFGQTPAGDYAQIGMHGIFIHRHAHSNVVSNNVIANTALDGVFVNGNDDDFYNTISQNTFSNIGGLAIDVPPISANTHIDPPVITSATTTGITGTSQHAGDTIEIYTTHGALGSSGPGNQYVTSVTSGVGGAFSASLTLNPGDIVTASATDSQGDTGNFAANVAVPGGNPVVNGMTLDYWSNVLGTSLTSIPQNTLPSSTRTWNSIVPTIDWNDNYGERVRGFLTPPTTGAYTFWIASDAASDLYLSTTSNPSQRVKIASDATATQWSNFGAASQKSVSINLVAGQSYFIEAYLKESTGTDFLQVAWTPPGGVRQVIPVQYLTPTTVGCAGWCA
jgi:CSLREA domain-containing protein